MFMNKKNSDLINVKYLNLFYKTFLIFNYKKTVRLKVILLFFIIFLTVDHAVR
jgi:hypothetical protein